VARTLRAAGNVVALSGEGADELFGGYDLALARAYALHRNGRATLAAAAATELEAASWIPSASLESILNPEILEAEGGPRATLDAYEDAFSAIGYDDEPDPFLSHLRVQRRVNLAGLLLRLDSATMLASVEGRTPFADALVAAHAESLPTADKFDAAPRDGESAADRAARTKLCLRRAYRADLPELVTRRAKASFPLPFQEWIATPEVVAPLLATNFASQVFTEPALAAVRANPAGLWRLAWPMLNLCLWSHTSST
ncbi:MAG: asparagine synthase-related protein, partial [Phycisphaerales bacterium]